MQSPVRWLAQKAFDWYTRNGFYGIARAIGSYGPSWSGESVTEASALNHSVVWACKRIISESVAFMPLNMMIEKNGAKNPATGHPTYQALKNAPNDEMTSMTFRETLTGHCVTGGMAYAKIGRRSGTGVAMEMYPLLPEQVHPARDKNQRLIYVVKDGNAAETTYTVEPGKPHDLLVIPGLGHDGVQGYSVITVARHSIGTASSIEKYAGKYFARGCRQPGALKVASKWAKKEDGDKFAEDLNKALDGPDGFHKWPIFEPGVEFQSAGWSPRDSQFLEARQYTIPEICRWFLISPHMVGDLSRATFSNIEQLALEFVKMTLTAWITRWEQNLWRCVLTPEEKAGGYFFRHNVNGLLRGDFASRMAGYATMLQNGIADIDEVRDLEDWNPLPNNLGKDHRVQLNMQIVGQPPPQLTAAQKDAERAFQLEQLVASLSQTLAQLKSKEYLQ